MIFHKFELLNFFLFSKFSSRISFPLNSVSFIVQFLSDKNKYEFINKKIIDAIQIYNLFFYKIQLIEKFELQNSLQKKLWKDYLM